jgi:hypothetical protein
MMDYVLQVDAAAPKLNSLTIPSKGRGQRWESHRLPVWSASTSPLASRTHGIEFFEMWNIRCSFLHGQDIGQFFSGWNSLSVLKIGAPPYKGSEGTCTPYFDKVASVRHS